MADEKNPPPRPGKMPDPRDEEIAAMKVQIAAQAEAMAAMQKQFAAGAVNAVDAVQERKSKAEQVALIAEIEKGTQQRTQEVCDRDFPEGRFRWRCVLSDGNRHPELIVTADNETDAGARYLKVCGVTTHDKPVTVGRA